MHRTDANQNYEATAHAFFEITRLLFFVGLFLRFFTDKATYYLKMMARTLQFYVLLALFDVGMPGSVLFLIKVITPLAFWDLLHGIDNDGAMKKWIWASDTDQPLTDQAAIIGFKDRNFLNNTKTVYLALVLYVI